jgi:hypothetical protein
MLKIICVVVFSASFWCTPAEALPFSVTGNLENGTDHIVLTLDINLKTGLSFIKITYYHSQI